MLAGRVFCPVCGASMSVNTNSGNKAGRRISYYVCGRYKWGRQNQGEILCEKTGYTVGETEGAVIAALLDACERPEAIRAAAALYARAQAPVISPAADPRRELGQVDKALAQIAAEEMNAVQAQLAGMRAGASPNVYAAVFADIAAQRKDLEDRRGVLAAQIRPKRDKNKQEQAGGAAAVIGSDEARRQALADAHRVLSSPDVAGAVKRTLLGTLIRRVTCHKGGATAYFLPGVLGAGMEDVSGVLTLKNVLLFYLHKIQRDLEETVIGAQLLAPLVRYNFGPNVPCPRFTLGTLDDGRLATAGRLIADLVAGKVIAPDEPWIRAYLGLPAPGE